jgi:hypothetical protein
MPEVEAYISPLGAPPLGAMARLRSPSLVYAVNHPAMSYGYVGCSGIGRSLLPCPPRERDGKEQGDGAVRFRDV